MIKSTKLRKTVTRDPILSQEMYVTDESGVICAPGNGGVITSIRPFFTLNPMVQKNPDVISGKNQVFIKYDVYLR